MTRSKKAALTAAALITVVTSAGADTLNWNGGVSGAWETGGAGWLNSGLADTWSDLDSAVFGGTEPLTISVNGEVSAGGLSFTAPNYVLGGTGTLTLSDSTISVSTGTATIDAGLAGSNLTKSGGGTLVFNGANKSFSGITINEGTVRVNGTAPSGSTLPAETFGASGSVVEINGGTLAMEFTAGMNTTSVNWPYKINVGPNGATLQNFGAQNATGPSGNQVGGGQVNLNSSGGTITGSGTLTLRPENSRFILNGNGGFTGKWVLIGNNSVNGGRVAVGGDSSFGNAPSTFTPDAVTLQNKALLSGGSPGGIAIGSANRGFTIGTGGGVFRTAGAGAIFTVAGPITGASGNNVTFQGDQGGTAASTLVVSNPDNDYAGNTILENTNSGTHTVRLGASDVFPHGEGKGTVSFISPNGTVDASNPRLIRLDLNGFNETINGFGSSAPQHVIDNINGAENSTSTLTVGAADVSSAFSGKIQNSVAGRTVALTKIGSGTLTLEGTNTYSGPTTISGGTLALGAGATLSETSNISVASGATFDVSALVEFELAAGQTLEGTGSVAGTILSAGPDSILSPGLSSGGTLTLETLDASLGANFKFELGTSADQIAIIDTFYGSVDAASLRFDFSAVAGFAAKTPYTLFTFDFADNLQIGDFLVDSLPAGYALDTTFGNGGWQVTDSTVQVQFVPEPATATLLLGGLGFLFGRRRRPAHA